MVKVITPPAVEPVKLADFQAWMQGLPISTDQELMVNSMLVSGREEAETYQNVAYCEQTLQIAPDDLSGAIVLPRPPFRELKSATAYLADGTQQDVAALYDINDMAWPTELNLKSDAALPGPLRTVNPLIITYTAGYDTVPEKVKQAILLYASWAWMHRGGDEQVPAAFYALLGKGRVVPV